MSPREPRSSRALSVAAVAERLCPSLWAELCAELDLEGASGLFATLEQRGSLTRTSGDSIWVAARRAEALSDFERRDPVLWRRAQMVCARFFARRGAEGDLGAAVTHFMAIGDRPSAEDLLRRWGAHVADRGWTPSLLGALDQLCQGDAKVPVWAHHLRARAHERAGNLDASLDAYERALAGDDDGPRPAFFPAPAAICGYAGRIAVRVGRLARGDRLLEKARHLTSGALPSPAIHLSARLHMSRGDLASAARDFEETARAAEAEGNSVELAEALSGLGVIAMREGAPLRAIPRYERALAVSVGGASEEQVARIQSNLAMAMAITGRAEAAAMFDEVARKRERLGDLSGAANSIAAFAGVCESTGDVGKAMSALSRARHLAEMGGEPALLMEIRLLRSGLSLRSGDVGTGGSELRAAEELGAGLEHSDPLLGAMLDEARAELSSARRAHAAAACLARRARRTFARHRAHYFLARVELLLARNAFSAGREGPALAHLGAFTRLAERGGYRFPGEWAASRVLEMGFERGPAAVRQRCRALLDAIARGEGRKETGAGGDYRIIDRRGARVANEAEVEQLRGAHKDLLVDLPRQRILRASAVVELSGQRVMVPLLLTLLARPNRWLDGRQLYREVWGSDRFDDAARNRVKVALSRLRTLLGAGVIVSRTEVGPTGETARVLGVAADLEYAVIERG